MANPNAKAARLIQKGEFTCYQSGKFLYTVKPGYEERAVSTEGTVLKLELVPNFGLTLQQAEAYAGAGDLLAYKPYGADQFIIAQDKSCANACRNPRKQGYKALGCFKEEVTSAGKTELVKDGKIHKVTIRVRFQDLGFGDKKVTADALLADSWVVK